MTSYNDMSRSDFYSAVLSVNPGKESRALNRAAKKKGYGNMVPIYKRYPDFPILTSIVALVASIVIPLLREFLEGTT